jgi:hypothetical protein
VSCTRLASAFFNCVFWGRHSTHQLFDFTGFNGDAGHEIFISAFRDKDVVFQADAQFFLRDVNAGFTREDPAWLDWFRGEPDIMDVEPEGIQNVRTLLIWLAGGVLKRSLRVNEQS